MNKLEKLKGYINKANSIVVLTGAGISVPSGIPDFRSSQGVYQTEYENLDPEVILSHSFFLKQPKVFYQFYRDKMIYQHAKPNIAHLTLAKIEQKGKLKSIITQNIDGLHQIAGSKNVIELHGSITRNYCIDCKKFYPLETIIESESIPKCECGGIIKPDVVLYEEPLNMTTLSQAVNDIEQADLCLVVGTSLLVNPASSLVNYFQGDKLVIINKSATPYDHHADLLIRDALEKILTEELLK